MVKNVFEDQKRNRAETFRAVGGSEVILIPFPRESGVAMF